jgi:hypothetical protein
MHQERLALCFFFAANYDAVLAPVLGPLTGEKAQFEHILAGQISQNYKSATRKQKKAFDDWAKVSLCDASGEGELIRSSSGAHQSSPRPGVNSRRGRGVA